MPVPSDASSHTISIAGLECSVIIPSAGGAASLGATLGSLFEQTLDGARYEVIVVDNNTDAVASERLRAVVEPTSARLVHAATPGPAAARNEGIRCAAGRIVVFVDDDVEVPHDFLDAHVSTHGADVRTVGIGRIVESNSHSRWFLRYLTERRVVNRAPDPDHVDFRTFYGANSSVPRAALVSVGGFDEGFRRREDAELAYRLMSAGYTFRFIERAVVQHHSTFGPVTHVRRSFWNGYYLAKLVDIHPAIAAHENLAPYSRLKMLLGAVAGPPLVLVGILVYPMTTWPLFNGITALVLYRNNRGFAAYKRESDRLTHPARSQR